MAVTSRIAAESRTVVQTTCWHDRPHSSWYGPIGTRPRLGLSPTRPHIAAGMRIDPPPSLALDAGTMPDATAAAAPAEEPPVPWSVFHGLRLGP